MNLHKHFRVPLLAIVALAAPMAVLAQNPKPTRPLDVNQTEGYAKGDVVAFTYGQSFDCVLAPFNDIDANGKVAAEQPSEFNPGIAAVGPLAGQPFSHCVLSFDPGIDPAGQPTSKTNKLFVLVPFFGADANPDDAFTPELGKTLIALFGTVPEAFRKTPTVAVQCPEPGAPRTKQKGMPGTCTTHTVTLDFGRILDKTLGLPQGTAVALPTPNHSHVIDQRNEKSVWWQIVSVLVTDPSAWPDADGTTGITSVEALRAAQAEGKAKPDTATNFFLFFGSHQFGHGQDQDADN